MKTKAVFAIVFCLLMSVFVLGQAPQQQPLKQPEPEKQMTTPGIPGIVAAGTKIERIWTGMRAADGVISEPDGTLLLPEQRANRIHKIDKDGKITLYLEDTNEAGGIAIDSRGRLIAVERNIPRVRELAPERKILADTFEGKPLARLSDVVSDNKGGVYFTEGSNSSVYYLNADGKLMRVANDIMGVNGISMSPDWKTLYTTAGNNGVLAYDIQPDTTIKNRRTFCKPEGGQDGLAVDAMGRLYAATAMGVQIFSPEGQPIGRIPMPRGNTSLAFAGPDKKTLYVIGRGNDLPGGDGRDGRSLYKIAMIAQGFKGRAK